MAERPAPRDDARTFDPQQILVSKADPRGRITYANEDFARVSGYSSESLLGRPHSVVRHPDMPRGLFAYVWRELEAGREAVAMMQNLTRDGRYYWVMAHITPTRDRSGHLIGYHSTRRQADRLAIEAVKPLYARMREEEAAYQNHYEAARGGLRVMVEWLDSWGQTYSEFVWSLINATGEDVTAPERYNTRGEPIGSRPARPSP